MDVGRINELVVRWGFTVLLNHSVRYNASCTQCFCLPKDNEIIIPTVDGLMFIQNFMWEGSLILRQSEVILSHSLGEEMILDHLRIRLVGAEEVGEGSV